MTTTVERALGSIDPATLVDRETMERLATRIVKDHPDTTMAAARRIVGQTAAFLAAGARHPGQQLAPSKTVDIGWHTWIIHTVDYAAFCDQVAGRFIHHVPTGEGETVEGGTEATRERTLAAIAAAGFTVDPELWPETAANGDCSQCHAGCTDSPVGK